MHKIYRASVHAQLILGINYPTTLAGETLPADHTSSRSLCNTAEGTEESLSHLKLKLTSCQSKGTPCLPFDFDRAESKVVTTKLY